MGRRHNTVLAVSPDRQLAQFRHRSLSDAGFEVVSVHSESAARYEIYLGQCGILLLCHTLPPSARESLAQDFEHRCPDPYIVAVLATPNDHFPPQAHKCILHSLDPSVLVKAVQEELAA